MALFGAKQGIRWTKEKEHLHGGRDESPLGRPLAHLGRKSPHWRGGGVGGLQPRQCCQDGLLLGRLLLHVVADVVVMLSEVVSMKIKGEWGK